MTDDYEQEQQNQDAASEEYQEPQPERVAEGEPQPSDFDDYDLYVKAVIDHRVNRAGVMGVGVAVEKGVQRAIEADRTAQAQAQAQVTLTPFPDDPQAGERSHWTQLSMDASREAIKHKETGNMEKYHEWRQRQLQYEAEIEKLGPKPEQEFVEAVADDADFRGINELFRKETADDKKWDHPRMQNDAAIVIARANKRNRSGVIALPMEASPFGEPMPVTPANMCQVKLPADQFERFNSMVYHSGGDDSPQAVIKRSWAALHQLGYAGAVIPAHEVKSRKKAEGEETDPDKMTMKEFIAWREKQEDERRGGPRKGFVLPKPRHGNG